MMAHMIPEDKVIQILRLESRGFKAQYRKMEYLSMSLTKTYLMLERFVISHCLISTMTNAGEFVHTSRMPSEIMTFGASHRGERFRDILKDASHVQHVHEQTSVGHNDFEKFKEYSAEYLRIKTLCPGSAKVKEFELTSDDNSMSFFKLITPEQLKRAEFSHDTPALPPSVNWLAKQLISSIIIGANFNGVDGFKEHYAIKLNWNASILLDECCTQVRYFNNPGFEANLSIGGRGININKIHGITKLKMNASTIITWMMPMGYLIDYSSMDFANCKALFMNCANLDKKPDEPNIMHDVTDSVLNLNLGDSTSSMSTST